MTDLFTASADTTLVNGKVVLVTDWTATRDFFGRILFTAWWRPGRFWAPDEPAGQCFLANPEEEAQRWADKGYTVRVEDEGWEPS